MTFAKPAAAALCALSLAACETMSQREAAGTVVGGALGALVGSQVGHHDDRVLMAGLGAAVGAYLGHEIGRKLDAREEAEHERAAQRALWESRSERAYGWGVPKGAHGQVRPTSPAYTDQFGRSCRSFTESVTFADGRTQMVDGVACLNRSGQWEVASM